MDEQKQLIAIAEACGWEWRRYEGAVCTIHFGWFDSTGTRRAHSYALEGKKKETNCLPRYTTDLNAMHEAKATLTEPIDQLHYHQCLCGNLTQTDDGEYIFGVCLYHALNTVTAAQEAKAFIQAKGKWEDNG